jgi:hypothetical protein
MSKFSTIKPPLGLQAALKGGKSGFITAFVAASLPAFSLDASPKEKLAFPFLSGIAGGIFGALIGGLSKFLPPVPDTNYDFRTNIKSQARGAGMGAGVAIGLLALGVCYMDNKLEHFRIFNP